MSETKTDGKVKDEIGRDVARLRAGAYWPRRRRPLPRALAGLRRGTTEWERAVHVECERAGGYAARLCPPSSTAVEVALAYRTAYREVYERAARLIDGRENSAVHNS